MPNAPRNSSDLMRYAGLATQLFVSLGLAVWFGYKADGWLHAPIPLLVWITPFVVLCALIFKIIKETSKKKKDGPTR